MIKETSAYGSATDQVIASIPKPNALAVLPRRPGAYLNGKRLEVKNAKLALLAETAGILREGTSEIDEIADRLGVSEEQVKQLVKTVEAGQRQTMVFKLRDTTRRDLSMQEWIRVHSLLLKVQKNKPSFPEEPVIKIVGPRIVYKNIRRADIENEIMTHSENGGSFGQICERMPYVPKIAIAAAFVRLQNTGRIGALPSDVPFEKTHHKLRELRRRKK